MLGKNQKLPAEFGDGSSLKVHSIFDTLQGEGPYSGHPALFIRLSGCNLACSFCDTEFDGYTTLSLEEILACVSSAVSTNFNFSVVVITGGEPFRQNIAPLCSRLIDAGYTVQIETNGLLYRPVDKRVKIVCSLKVVGGRYCSVHPDFLDHYLVFKFLVSDSISGYDDLPMDEVIGFGKPIYVQPMDEYDPEKNARNIALAMKLAKMHNVILCLQLHKILNID